MHVQEGNTHNTETFGGSVHVGEQVTEEISAARGEEVDVSVRTVEVGEGRC